MSMSWKNRDTGMCVFVCERVTAETEQSSESYSIPVITSWKMRTVLICHHNMTDRRRTVIILIGHQAFTHPHKQKHAQALTRAGIVSFSLVLKTEVRHS